MKAVSLGSQPGVGFVANAEPAGEPHEASRPLKGLSVKATLRLAFALLLIGTLVIGVFSLAQIGRLNGSAQSIYAQGHVASHAAEEARGYVLRASRAQKMLLTATTGKERDELGADIDKGLAGLSAQLGTLQQYADPTDTDAAAQQQKFAAAVATWSGHLRDFVTLVKAQPLDLSQMNWQVGTQDVSLLVETGKLEKLVDGLVEQRDVAAKATIEASGFIYHSSFVTMAAMTAGLIVLAFVISEWVVRRLARQLGGEPFYAREIASRIASGDLSNQIALTRNDHSSMLSALHDMQGGLSTTVSDKRVTDIMGEISAASAEQSSGIEEINLAVTQMDAGTQQNAALVEQATAAARSLDDQAKALKVMVGRFKLN
jgi:methyl-accepting chemotaxis protein